MNKKSLNLIIGLVFVVGLGVFLVLYRPAPATQTSQSASGEALLAATESAFDFGTISMAKGNVNHEFKIKNDKQSNLTITKLYSSCMCTSAELYIGGKKVAGPFGMEMHSPIPRIKEILEPGEEAVILATFDPAAHGPAGIGQINREIYIEVDNSAPLTLKINANVTP